MPLSASPRFGDHPSELLSTQLVYTPAVQAPDVVQHPTYPCIVSWIHDEPLEQTAGCAEFPPIHPQTFTSTEVLLNNSAGSAGLPVGFGDQGSAWYAYVF